MKIVVFGATGKTGREIVTQALAKGHEVTAFARDPEKALRSHPSLAVVKGDILDHASVAAAVRGQEAAVSALGVAKLGKSTALSEGTRNIVSALEEHGVSRFVCQSSIGVGDSRAQTPQMGFVFSRIVAPLLLRNVLADKERQERYVMKSALEWTLVRPAVLTDGPRTGSYRVGFAADDPGVEGRISRADVADFILEEIEEGRYVRGTPSISY